MSSRVVQVLLNTNNYINGSTTNNATFFVDWGAILKQNTPYFVHFTYVGGSNVYNGTRPALVSINFNFDTYVASGQGGAQTSNIMGFLKPVIIAPGSFTVFLQAETNTNEPVYMERRPISNMFTVKIVDTAGNLWVDNAATPVVPAGWVMTMHFTEATP